MAGADLVLGGAPSGITGTDLATDSIFVPCIQHELELLVRAGLTPAEALRTATLNPAKFFNATDSLGTIESGKLADLVLLDVDPLTDIAHMKAICAMVANGRYYVA